jgi:general secretion pathway protein K
MTAAAQSYGMCARLNVEDALAAPRGQAGAEPSSRHRRKQQGAAVLLALFVAALATMIVSALFYRQFVLLRTIENQQLMAQSRLLLRGALDWGRAILREDANRSSYDALSEPWAQPLAETRLDQLGETSVLAAQASIAGSMEDAQSRLNLRNLIDKGEIVESELEALRQLCTLLQVPAQTAELIAQRMQLALPSNVVDDGGRAPDSAGVGSTVRPIPLMLPQDLLSIPGISAEAAQRLAPYIVVLDERTPVNVNTARPEVIAARVPEMSLSDARALVAERERISYFNNVGEVRTRLGAKANGVGEADIATASRFFFVRGEVKLDRAVTRMEALVRRGVPGQGIQPVTVLWIREI